MIYIVMAIMLVIYVGSVLIYQNYSKKKNGGVECGTSGCVSCVAASSCGRKNKEATKKVN